MKSEKINPDNVAANLINFDFDVFRDSSNIVIIGASYARGWNEPVLGSIGFSNKGVDGQQSFEMLQRFERDVISQQPHAVFIWGFINDIFRAERSEIEAVLERTKESFDRMVSLSRQNKVIPVLLTEVTIRGEDNLKSDFMMWIGKLLGKKSYQDYVNGKVMEINNWLREYAVNNNTMLIDIQPLLSDHNGIRRKKYAKPDGSHITEAGYARMTEFLYSIWNQ